MDSAVEVRGLNGQKLTVEVSIGMRTARDLHSMLLDAAYSLKNNESTFLALLFKCGITPERLAKEIEAFKDIVRPEVGSRVHVLAVSPEDDLSRTLTAYVNAAQLDELHRSVLEESSGTAKASSRQDVQFLLLHRWLLGQAPIKTAELAVQSGASQPTVYAALADLVQADILRTRDRRVALKNFSPQAWQKWLTRSAEAQTVKFIDRSGAPRSPEKLARTLSAMALNNVAIGGVLGVMHHCPAIDITGAPHLDVLVHGTQHADLSFIERLDPGLVRDDSADARPHVRVHFTNRRDSYFEVGEGAVWADVLDCVVHMWQAGLNHQVEDLIGHLSQQAQLHKGT
jgi:hypothetical protein